jgi:hypothetical protein
MASPNKISNKQVASMGNYKETIRRVMVLFLISQIVIIVGLAAEGHSDYIRSVVGTAALWIVYTFSLFFYVLAAQLLRHPVNRLFKFILIVSLGLSLGTFYEILEFLTDTFSHPALVSQPSLLDTDLDLIGDLIGAVLAGIHASSTTFMDQNF